MIGCLEEVAWRNGWITETEIQNSIIAFKGNNYSQYLQSLLGENV